LDGAHGEAHTDLTSTKPESRTESERLARLCFDAGRDPDFPRRFKELLHPDVAVSLKAAAGAWLHGADAVGEVLDERAGSAVYEAVDERYHPLDDERIVVEGRLRWTDEERMLRDDPAVWAIEFRDGLLFRSIAARSVAEAEALLTAGRGEGPS
jgi:hypothetical protein